MNELVWEGLIEILRGNQPSLKVTARLWRRDDFFGADWGGQLELPVVFRRLLPPGEYAVRLPSGAQGSSRITPGPSTTSMTFPTLTGVGHPPFGGAESRPLVELETEPEDEMTQEPAAQTSPSGTDGTTPASLEAVASALAPNEQPARVAAAVLAPEAEAPAAAARKLTLVEPHADRSHVPSQNGGLAPARLEALEQTEAMARAYLASVDARQRLLAVVRPGFEGRAIDAARQDIDAATVTLEGALRARAGTDRWPQELTEHLVALSWFAALAVPDEQPEVAGAGRAVLALVASIETLLGAASTVRSYARAAA